MIAAIRLIDEQGGIDDQPVNAALTSAFWSMATDAGARSWLDQAWTIYRLSQPVRAQVLANDQMRELNVEVWEVWESVKASSDHRRPRYDWREFCLHRLGMTHKIASAMKRTYEIFGIVMGLDHKDLLVAGKRKLERAAPTVARDWTKGLIDDKLWELLFGEPHVCLACSEVVDYESWPETCPHCDQPYAEMEPGTFGQVDAYIHLRNAEQSRDQAVEGNVYDYSLAGVQGDRERYLVTWVRRPGDLMATPYELGKVTRLGGRADSTTEGGGILDGEELEEAWTVLEAAIRRAGK